MEQMQRYVQMGFAGCKFKVGGASPKEDAERVKAAREAAGNDFILLVDANQGYTRDHAVDFGRRVYDLRICWFEEHCRSIHDCLWMRDVRHMTRLRVAAGQ